MIGSNFWKNLLCFIKWMNPFYAERKRKELIKLINMPDEEFYKDYPKLPPVDNKQDAKILMDKYLEECNEWWNQKWEKYK